MPWLGGGCATGKPRLHSAWRLPVVHGHSIVVAAR